MEKDLVIMADAEHCVELDEVEEVLLREPVGITSVPVKVNTADSECVPRKPVRGHQQDWRLIWPIRNWLTSICRQFEN